MTAHLTRRGVGQVMVAYLGLNASNGMSSLHGLACRHISLSTANTKQQVNNQWTILGQNPYGTVRTANSKAIPCSTATGVKQELFIYEICGSVVKS